MEKDLRISKKKKAPGPIEYLFLFMERNLTVEIWTEHNPNLKFQGKIIGFDEWMNLTLDHTQEINVKKGTVTDIGKIILKGDVISVVHLLAPENFK